MQYDYIILGQGICGTLLSRCLMQAGRKVLVIDKPAQFSASKVASGVINPVTGRRVVRTWLIEEVLPYAWQVYNELEAELGVPVVRQCNILDFYPSQQMKDAYEQRAAEGEEYINPKANETPWRGSFNFSYGIGEIDPCLLVDVNTLLTNWRQKLIDNDALMEDQFEWSNCIVTLEGVTYKGITAEKIICCEGAPGAANPYFNRLPYSVDKGEAIIADIPGLPRTNIYKQGLTIVPWQNDLFWIGSSHEWKYTDVQPTEAFRKKVEDQLKYWLRLPYIIIDHWAAERPTNMERRPFVGWHPVHPAVGILNGMGTKGCSLAPYFAEQLAQNLLSGAEITPEADVRRFVRVLSR